MQIKFYADKEKMKRRTGIAQLIFGLICLGISIGLFATMDKYAIPVFAFVASLFMILTSISNISQ